MKIKQKSYFFSFKARWMERKKCAKTVNIWQSFQTEKLSHTQRKQKQKSAEIVLYGDKNILAVLYLFFGAN
jgi:hypothetical protein